MVSIYTNNFRYGSSVGRDGEKMRYHQNKGKKTQVHLHRKAIIFSVAPQMEHEPQPCFHPYLEERQEEPARRGMLSTAGVYGLIVTGEKRDCSSVSSVKQEEWNG